MNTRVSTFEGSPAGVAGQLQGFLNYQQLSREDVTVVPSTMVVDGQVRMIILVIWVPKP